MIDDLQPQIFVELRQLCGVSSFQDESAIAEAGWASQEASDLLGRWLRSMSDKGVVAVLDPRLATARNGGFLRATLPRFWATYDPEVVKAALKRLDAAQTPLIRSTSSSRYSRTA